MKNESGKKQKLLSLLVIIGIIFSVWGILLPAVSQNREFASEVVDREIKGIDPSAMFYTDLDAAEEISLRIEKNVRKNPDLLWKWNH